MKNNYHTKMHKFVIPFFVNHNRPIGRQPLCFSHDIFFSPRIPYVRYYAEFWEYRRKLLIDMIGLYYDR